MSALKDLKTGQLDVALALYAFGFVIACIKLLLSGVTVYSVTLSQFNGGDFAMVTGALGAIYTARKHSDGITRKRSENESVKP